MMFTFFLLILPPLVLASINIDLNGQFKGNTLDLKLNFSGEDVAPLTGIEVNTFNLTNENLKYAVDMCMLKYPERVYLRVPDDIRTYYMKNGYLDGARVIEIRSGKILNISNPVDITLKSFENYSQKPISSTIEIFQEIYNTAITTWSKQRDLSVGKINSYNIDIDFPEDRTSISMFFTSLWGQNSKLSQTMSFYNLSPIDFVLDSAQSINVLFQVTKYSIQIELEYKGVLSGDITAYFPEKYDGSYYQAIPLDTCMMSAGFPFETLSREVIDIEFYRNPKIIVYNKSNDSKIMEFGFPG